MKLSEISVEYARDYCGVSDESENERIQTCMSAAKAFILGYTGLETDTADEHDDITAAYLVLINEMYTNRDYTVDSSARNPFVRQVLSMHSVNYL